MMQEPKIMRPASSAATEGMAELDAVTDLILDYLKSKSLFETQSALQVELALLQEATIAKGDLMPSTNLYVSELERRLGTDPLPTGVQSSQSPTPIANNTLTSVMAKVPEQLDATSADEERCDDNGAPEPPAPQKRIRLYTFHKFASSHDEGMLRDRFDCSSTDSGGVVCHDRPVMPREDAASLAHLSLPVVYNPNVSSREDDSELTLEVGSVVIGRYKIVALLGKGTFACVYQCLDMLSNSMVAIKVWMPPVVQAALGEAAHHQAFPCAARRSFAMEKTASMQASEKSGCSWRSQSSIRTPSWHGCS